MSIVAIYGSIASIMLFGIPARLSEFSRICGSIVIVIVTAWLLLLGFIRTFWELAGAIIVRFIGMGIM